ncbi:MAG TPA: hypothetical protein VHG27_09085 [Xanthobacteraceae bacterium]|nr:hypothetical protein [Xanthobacteraceae bacterium]
MPRKGMGKGLNGGHQGVGAPDPKGLDEEDLASEVQGRNKLQGNDQTQVRNQRRSAPDTPAPRKRPSSGR